MLEYNCVKSLFQLGLTEINNIECNIDFLTRIITLRVWFIIVMLSGYGHRRLAWVCQLSLSCLVLCTYLICIIIINILFIPQYKTKQKSQNTIYKLLIKKLSENCSIEVNCLHHSIQATFNKTISIFKRKLPQSNVTKPSIALQLMTQFVAEQPEYCL